MSAFNILAFGEFICGQHTPLVISAYAKFYHNVTAKHQKRIMLVLVDNGDNMQALAAQAQDYKLSGAIRILHAHKTNDIESYYKSASVMLLPAQQRVGMIVSEALSFGIPVLCFEDDQMKEYIDQTCGMFVRYRTPEQSSSEFASMMRMLYFDPEARKVLKKGASKKYENYFSWGGRLTSRASAR